jgi:hypothetical protein
MWIPLILTIAVSEIAICCLGPGSTAIPDSAGGGRSGVIAASPFQASI